MALICVVRSICSYLAALGLNPRYVTSSYLYGPLSHLNGLPPCVYAGSLLRPWLGYKKKIYRNLENS